MVKGPVGHLTRPRCYLRELLFKSRGKVLVTYTSRYNLDLVLYIKSVDRQILRLSICKMWSVRNRVRIRNLEKKSPSIYHLHRPNFFFPFFHSHSLPLFPFCWRLNLPLADIFSPTFIFFSFSPSKKNYLRKCEMSSFYFPFLSSFN